jgi:hypothetical protein
MLVVSGKHIPQSGREAEAIAADAAAPPLSVEKEEGARRLARSDAELWQ